MITAMRRRALVASLDRVGLAARTAPRAHAGCAYSTSGVARPSSASVAAARKQKLLTLQPRSRPVSLCPLVPCPLVPLSLVFQQVGALRVRELWRGHGGGVRVQLGGAAHVQLGRAGGVRRAAGERVLRPSAVMSPATTRRTTMQGSRPALGAVAHCRPASHPGPLAEPCVRAPGGARVLEFHGTRRHLHVWHIFCPD